MKMTRKEADTVYFRNNKGEIQYNKKCAVCTQDCKQSFKVKLIACKRYERAK